LQEKYQSYLEYYIDNIKPAINELDIAIKCKSRLKNKDIAEILGTSEQEIENIRTECNIKIINQKSLMRIMQKSSSSLCKIFQRELEVGSPFTYTIEQFAYIYDLDKDLVIEVCDELNVSEITWQSMPTVFGFLPYMN